MNAPTPTTTFCDHGEQMLAPVKALGSEYAAVMFRPRVTGDMGIWRVVGTVDGTTLTYSQSVGGPPSLSAGQDLELITDQPFTIQSQDAQFTCSSCSPSASGSGWTQLSDTTGYGDPEIVAGIPIQQFVRRAAFYTDPLFPETNLVVVRTKDAEGAFDDVTLDCAGALSGWQSVGSYEWTRIDLSRHDFVGQGGCKAGSHEMHSQAPFGLSVWGWGSPETTIMTARNSYGYVAAMGVQPINDVVIPPVPH